jgi:hypothetical protein
VLGLGEGGVSRRLVAEVPVVDRVVRRLVVDLRRAGLPAPAPCRRRRAAPRSRLSTFSAASLGLRQRFGDDDGDMVADVAHLVAPARMGAAFIGEPSFEWIIQPQISPPTLSAAMSSPVSTATTPGRRAPRGVDLLDVRVRMRRAQEVGVRLARAG